MPAVVSVPERINQSSYEPTVHDKIQRIIYRLEHGEELISGNLMRRGQFADESGLGDWFGSIYYESDTKSVTVLSESISTYYNLQNRSGKFYLADLSDDVQNKLSIFKPNVDGTFSLMAINDSVLFCMDNNININQLLADIIRSGAVFNG